MSDKKILQTTFITVIILFFLLYGFYNVYNLIDSPLNKTENNSGSIIERRDIVFVQYTLWVYNGSLINETGEGKVYIDFPENDVPIDVIINYPDIRRVPNIGFYYGMLGRANNTEFVIDVDSTDGFTNSSHRFYGRSLLYEVYAYIIEKYNSDGNNELIDNLIVISIMFTFGILLVTRLNRVLKRKSVAFNRSECVLCNNVAELQCLNDKMCYCRKCAMSLNTCRVFKPIK